MELRNAASAKIVKLFQRKPPVNFSAISQVDAYWEALRGERTMPARAEVDPRGLDGALEHAFILEHIAPGVGRIRVAGMHLNDLLGMEVRGMPLTALFLPGARGTLSDVLQAVVEAPQVAEIDLSAERGIGRPELAARLYLAPLSHDGRGAPRVLGCLQSAGGIGRAPRRFGIDRIRVRALTHADYAPAAPRAKAPTIRGFSDPQRAFAHHDAGQTEPQRPVLRLVKND